MDRRRFLQTALAAAAGTCLPVPKQRAPKKRVYHHGRLNREVRAHFSGDFHVGHYHMPSLREYSGNIGMLVTGVPIPGGGCYGSH